MPDTPFVTHAHDSIPLDRNVVPIPECRVTSALQNGKVIKAVDVKLLSCASVWLRCQQEAEKWITDCEEEILSRPEQVNARISAAYAYLWMTDHRFQWAGLAAFASKQVGCGLLHSATMAKEARANLQATPKFMGGEVLPNGLYNQGVEQGANHMRQQLALGNRTLFLDIYPLHRFYMLRGIEGIRRCLGERQTISDKVEWWPKKFKETLPFGFPFKEVLAGFEAIERNDVAESVRQLAKHEQVNVLQKILYEDPYTQWLLDGNQAAWVTGMPSGLYEEVQLTLSAECKPKRTAATVFKKSVAVHLYNSNDRMEFVYRAAEDFDKLLRKHRPDVERSMREIFYGRGIR
jgi:hypothetical protein